MVASPSNDYDFLFKLLLVGNSGVGKSNMLLRFSDDEYKTDMESTIGVDFKVCTRVIGASTVKMQIWDTAGQERFRTITASYYRGSHGIMVVYDVTDRQSFVHVRGWMEEISKYAKENVRRLLVGNKCDLISKRVVSTDDGCDLAQDLGVDFIETSAKNSHNIDHSFDRLCREVVKEHSGASVADETASVQLQQRLTNLAGPGCCK